MRKGEQGLLVVLSGPSGSGKDTVLEELRKTEADLALSVSLTSRAKRPWEADGTHYHFVTREYFEQSLRAGDILEHTQYSGNYYGTPKAPVDAWLSRGKTVVLIIEVEGAANIRALYPGSVSVFLLPPSLDALRQRLFRRESEKEDEIARRTEIAKREIARARTYDYVILNDMLDDAVGDLRAIIRAERRRAGRRTNLIDEVLKSC